IDDKSLQTLKKLDICDRKDGISREEFREISQVKTSPLGNLLLDAGNDYDRGYVRYVEDSCGDYDSKFNNYVAKKCENKNVVKYNECVQDHMMVGSEERNRFLK